MVASMADGTKPAVRERPILFSADMVRAVRDGRKTQTRRPLKLPRCMQWYAELGGEREGWYCDVGGRGWWSVDELACPFGRVGDQLWVRETWKPHSAYAGLPPRMIPESKVFYAADDSYAPSNTSWIPSIHMPRWASRITLEVSDVRVQRLGDISDDDAIAEGVMPAVGGDWTGATGQRGMTPLAAFALLWGSIYGAGSWDANPWVWALTFRRVEVR